MKEKRLAMKLKDFWLEIDRLANKPESHPDIEVKLMTLDGEWDISLIEILKDSHGANYLAIQSLEQDYDDPISMGWVGSDGQP